MANICQYDFQAGQIQIQELNSELFSIVVYEAILKSDQQIDFELPTTLISLFFTLQGTVAIQQLSIPKFVQEIGFYTMAYYPANTKLKISLAKGCTLLFRIDYKVDTLHELSEDYILLHRMLRAANEGSTISRRLHSAILDTFVRLNLRQLFEYSGTKSERSLFIHARCIDLLRHYLPSSHLKLWDDSTEDRRIIAQITRVAAFIELHLDSQLLRSSLAKTHNLSARSLERYFAKYYGQSVGKYILEKRMIRALELLKETTLSLLDITLSVGYSELTNFTRAFKAFYGYSPSKTRLLR